MSELYTRFDSVFFEKTRLTILTVLYHEQEVSFARLKRILGSSDGAVYSHLDKLLNAGYINRKKEVAGMDVKTVYSLTPDGKKNFMEYLDFLRDVIQGEIRENN